VIETETHESGVGKEVGMDTATELIGGEEEIAKG
jgi:hypothetical protein